MHRHPIYKLCPKCNGRLHSEFGDCFPCKAREIFTMIPVKGRHTKQINNTYAHPLVASINQGANNHE